jgi:hypothetical protein
MAMAMAMAMTMAMSMSMGKYRDGDRSTPQGSNTVPSLSPPLPAFLRTPQSSQTAARLVPCVSAARRVLGARCSSLVGS